jgi:ABC-type multidrug transport system fused ATPase/permease subunit
MIRHYLKVAFRNLRKYRNQTLVSVVGLAVGFVCFAMATLWIRYEMTYDSFHKNADRMYCVYKSDNYDPNSIHRSTSYPLARHLKSVFPEIANAVSVSKERPDFLYGGVNFKADMLRVDSSSFGMFDIRIVEGNMDFVIPEMKKIAITREKALLMFGNESPVGKKMMIKTIISLESEYEICAVVTRLPKQSNYSFDFLGAIEHRDDNWSVVNTLVELFPDIDMEMFKKKLYEHEIPSGVCFARNMTLVPITSMHYTDPNAARGVKFQHIIVFALVGTLLILCTLFNYLTLFVSRFVMRQRELALRTVYGASVWSLFAMLSVEFIMSLIATLVLGLLLINILKTSFMTVSEIQLKLSAIYLESIIYMVGVIVVALVIFFLTLTLFRRCTLNANIRGNKKILRKASIVVQLIVSIVFAFCTLIILKQMYYLHSTADLGFALKNRGSINIRIEPEQIKVLNNKIKQIPEIKETLTGHQPLLPMGIAAMDDIYDWDGKQTDNESIQVQCSGISEEYVKFYELELIEGEFLRDDDDTKYILINETTAKALGWHKATGKSFSTGSRYTVKGVVKNIHNFPPTIAAQSVWYVHGRGKSPYILFKYDEGSWKTCMKKIKRIVEKEFPNKYYEYHNAEEEYDKYLKSENALLAILTVVSLVCMIVCIFGFVSMVSLTCEERRKEIAIRKINGATIKDILDIFFKEHLTLLAIGALIAFPTGYIIMKRWLENYVIQTEMSAWVYVSILLALIMVIVACVGGRVYKTSRENPVNAINR